MTQDNISNNKPTRDAPNLFRKMFASFIIVPIIPIIALLLLAYTSQEEGKSLAEKNLTSASELIGSKINKWVEKNVFISNLASELDDIVSMDPERQKPILKKIKENSTAITAVRVDDAKGMAAARSDNKSLKNYSDRIYFKQVLSGAKVGQQVIIGKTQKKPLLCFTVPINEEGEFIGALNQCATLEDISNNVTNLKIGESGFAFLVDSSNQLIASGSDAGLSNMLQNMSKHPAIKSGGLSEFINYEDNGNKIAYKTSVGLDWTLVIQQDYNEAFSAPITTRNNTIITIIVTTLASLLFVYLLSRGISKPLEAAKKETDNILSSVNDGLFLINSDYIIGTQQSNNLPEILQKDALAGTSFARYLSDAVPIDVAELAKDYIDLLFTDRIKEELIQTRNPLKLVKTSVENREGALESRYLSLTFKRVYDGEIISDLLVTAKDITSETLLKAELEKLKQEKNQQVNLLAEILHIPSPQIRKFLTETDISLNKINDVLEHSGSTSAEYKSKVKSIFQLIHKIKGDASALNFELFAKECHNFEDILGTMNQQTNDLTGNEFLPVTIALEELFKNCHIVNILLDKIGAFGTGVGSETIDINDISGAEEMSSKGKKLQEWRQLENMATRIAEKYGKEVEVHFQGFKHELPENYHEAFKDITTQLIRNSIVHGIEETETRESCSKTREGQITVTLKHTNRDGLTLIYKDDGKGVDYEKIRSKIIENKHFSIEKAGKLTNQELLQVAFKHGFSLASEANLDAGRGVGLSLVADKAKELNGKMKVASLLGKGFALKIVIPEPADA
ncbi:MAG: HPt (histidine-containing phosphotransfer) domain-containing protein [Cellvibrionaceae bacterium]|jgi:HPt (histidine-containing phosphotransfer) domain-containing protein